MREHLETSAVKDKEHNRPLQLQERRHRLTEETRKEMNVLEEKALQESENLLNGKCTELSCDL